MRKVAFTLVALVLVITSLPLLAVGATGGVPVTPPHPRDLDVTAPNGAGIACPVAGPVSFTDTWGAPRSGGRQHRGVDMFAAPGTPVVAPAPGDVSFYDDSLGGLSFRLWGDDGSYYYGTHLSRYGPRTGHVEAGAVVGYVGATGNAAGSGAHLHFEIHPGRRPGDPSSPANPTPAVAAACGSVRVGVASSAGA